jgi:hypothetical protein
MRIIYFIKIKKNLRIFQMKKMKNFYLAVNYAIKSTKKNNKLEVIYRKRIQGKAFNTKINKKSGTRERE